MIHCVRQMAEAVAFMHEYGIIHRDIKGENFVFVEDPHHAALNKRAPAIKLIDLGMSMLYNPDKPVVGAVRPQRVLAHGRAG